ncbi:discoidin domain-containing protein [Streptomyces sp. NPDC091266]|uniref:discoidin domain-containing protein n=1 Tax=Streptomyces sp. NPDC091266 TaxID=3365978 RepID=UPI003800DB75
MRIVRSAGDVQRPDALLEPGGKVTVLRRDQPPAVPRWPEGTTAEASSTHPGNNGNDGSPRTYEAKHAVDGDLGTFWNDDTEHDFPDTLTLTTPEERELSGVTVVSSTDGVPTAFTVAVRAGAAWRTVATVTGNHAVQRAVRFDSPVSTNRVRISVTAVQDLGRGVFTRINEVWPEAVDPVAAPSVTLDFGKVVVGYPKVDFAWASDNHPGVRLAFFETLHHLTERSDFTRADQAGGAGQGTDQYAVPAGGASWTDQKGYGSGGDKVYADGLHGFRYLKITLDALPSDAPAAQPWGTVAIDAVALDFTA